MSEPDRSRAGETIGNYRIIESIGSGGMGEVYLAEHPVIGRRVAVKLLRPALSHNADVVGRFFNEARASALIRHPGIIDVLDFGYHASGAAYIVMEYLDGESLATCLLRGGSLPEGRAIAVARQVAVAVGAAHAAGIIHRDLKPDNVYLLADPHAPGGERAKVLDFGIAKLSAEVSMVSKTRTGSIMGSPLYMSPEQCRDSSALDHRTDIYALGCVAFEMVCGRPPFVATGMGEAAAMHLYEEPPLARDVVPGLSAGLEAILARCLAKSPDDRFGSMAELAAALDAAAEGVPVGLTPVPAARGAPSIAHSTTLSGAAHEIDRVPTRRGRWWAIGALVAAAGAVAYGVVATRTDAPPEPGARPSPPPQPTPAPAPARREPSRPAAPAKVTLRIDSRPPGAAVVRASDGAVVGKTPFEMTGDAASGRVRFLVKLAGYRDENVDLAADRDDSRDMTLVKAKARERPLPDEQKRVKGQPLDVFGNGEHEH